MSTSAEPLPPAVRSPSPTAERVEELVCALPAAGLDDLDEWAALATRVDRKYVVPLTTFEALLGTLDDDWHALEIGGRRLFGYTSTYFDTPGLATYRAHLQGRRRRFKVRVRRYDDSDSCMLEVKRKGLRGLTVKERTPHPVWQTEELGRAGRTFVETTVRAHASVPDDDLRAVVTTSNRRATLVNGVSGSRLTVDVDLRCGRGERFSVLREGYLVLESKSEGAASEVDRRLRRLGQRPGSISKYCIGVASLGLGLPDNPWRRVLRGYFHTPTSQELP